jgi:acyl carrier protein
MVFGPSHDLRKKGLAKYLAEQIGIDESQVGAHFESLGSSDVDSLDLVELILELEELPE